MVDRRVLSGGELALLRESAECAAEELERADRRFRAWQRRKVAA